MAVNNNHIDTNMVVFHNKSNFDYTILFHFHYLDNNHFDNNFLILPFVHHFHDIDLDLHQKNNFCYYLKIKWNFIRASRHNSIMGFKRT